MKFSGMAVMGMHRMLKSKPVASVKQHKPKPKPIVQTKSVPKPVRKVIINKALPENNQERMLNRPFYRNYTPKKS